MNYIKPLFLFAIVIVFNSCCKPAPCTPFSADELAWIPYNDGDVFYLKSDSTGRMYKFTVKKQHEGTTKATCHEGQNYCLGYLNYMLKGDSLLTVSLNLDNTTSKDSKSNENYSVSFSIDDTKVFISKTNNSNLQSKVLNSVIYHNVSSFITFDKKHVLYYAKEYGVIAYNDLITNEWLYKL
jgi:hypothetical protein